MSLRANNNIAAINTQHNIGRNSMRVYRQLERLSSGLRVNRARDDAASLVVSEGLRGELSGLNQNVRNAEQATNLLQVAEGSLGEVNNILVRMRELAVQSSSSTLSDSNRESLAAEFNQLVSEIDRIADSTTYNKQSLLSGFGNSVSATASTAIATSNATGVAGVSLAAAPAGTFTFVDTAADGELTLGNGAVTQTLDIGPLLDGTNVASGTSVIANFDRLGLQVTLAGANASGATGSYTDGDLSGTTIAIEEGTGGVFQVGPSEGFVNRIEVNFEDLSGTGNYLNLGSVGIDAINNARASIATIDQAVANVANERGKMGAVQNRLNFTIAYTENEIESIQASESSIRDADMAAEVAKLSRGQILLQASNSMLVQANIGPVAVLSLL
ncbi:MAG: flagellin [Gemmatimonadetes bacterium]|nr:flagellin [Gemmatimonadota bacterium]